LVQQSHRRARLSQNHVRCVSALGLTDGRTVAMAFKRSRLVYLFFVILSQYLFSSCAVYLKDAYVAPCESISMDDWQLKPHVQAFMPGPAYPETYSGVYKVIVEAKRMRDKTGPSPTFDSLRLQVDTGPVYVLCEYKLDSNRYEKPAVHYEYDFGLANLPEDGDSISIILFGRFDGENYSLSFDYDQPYVMRRIQE